MIIIQLNIQQFLLISNINTNNKYINTNKNNK